MEDHKSRIEVHSTPPTPESSHTYQYVRNLGGIIGTLYEPACNTPPQTRSLGVRSDRYLLAHGYTATSMNQIAEAYHTSDRIEEFTFSLCPQGMPYTEAVWLWGLITGC